MEIDMRLQGNLLCAFLTLAVVAPVNAQSPAASANAANAFDGISDEELNESLESIRRVLAARTPIGDAKGGPAPGGSAKLN